MSLPCSPQNNLWFLSLPLKLISGGIIKRIGQLREIMDGHLWNMMMQLIFTRLISESDCNVKSLLKFLAERLGVLKVNIVFLEMLNFTGIYLMQLPLAHRNCYTFLFSMNKTKCKEHFKRIMPLKTRLTTKKSMESYNHWLDFVLTVVGREAPWELPVFNCSSETLRVISRSLNIWLVSDFFVLATSA